MFYLAGIIITFFLSVLLAGKKNKSEADKILTVWLVVMGIHLTLFYLFITEEFFKISWLMGVELPLPLVHGPFLFLYTTSLTRERKIKSIGWLHFFPVVIIYLLEIPFFLLSPERKVFVYKNKGAGFEWLSEGIFYPIVASGIIYVILSFLRLRKHRLIIENRFSNTAKINLNWLRYLVYGIAVIWIVIISGLNDSVIFGTVVVFVFFLGYFGIRQVGIFSNINQAERKIDLPPAEIPEPQSLSQNDLINNVSVTVESNTGVVNTSGINQPAAKPKYQKSSLTAEEATRIHEQLKQVMLKEKLFKNPELNLGELAETLDIHPNNLSQVINSFESKTFYDYINSLRIDEFKKLVTDPESKQYTLLSLAFECGFNSKTAFNRNFKKSTGLSPSEYMSKNSIQLV